MVEKSDPIVAKGVSMFDLSFTRDHKASPLNGAVRPTDPTPHVLVSLFASLIKKK